MMAPRMGRGDDEGDQGGKEQRWGRWAWTGEARLRSEMRAGRFDPSTPAFYHYKDFVFFFFVSYWPGE